MVSLSVSSTFTSVAVFCLFVFLLNRSGAIRAHDVSGLFVFVWVVVFFFFCGGGKGFVCSGLVFVLFWFSLVVVGFLVCLFFVLLLLFVLNEIQETSRCCFRQDPPFLSFLFSLFFCSFYSLFFLFWHYSPVCFRNTSSKAVLSS